MIDRRLFTKPATPPVIGPQRQLFLDDFLIDEMAGLSRTMHQPTKRGPVLTPDSDAGEIALQSRSVPQWNSAKNLWEWWYWGGWACEPYGPYKTTQLSLTQYITSADGVAWHKPSLGLYEWNGSRDNNVAMDPQAGHRALYHCIRDEHESDPARRYKALMGHANRKPMVSADGFAWKPVEVADIPSSDESHFFYDPTQQRFVGMVKRGTVWGRSVFYVSTADFIEWQEHGIVLHADDIDWANRLPRVLAAAADARFLSPPLIDEQDYIAETYQMAVMPYEGIYVGFPGIFNPAGAIPPPQMNHTGLNQTELAMSRDLLHWRRLCDREVFLGISPWQAEDGSVNWDTAQLLPCGHPLVIGDEIFIYYNACRFRGHKEIYPAKFWPYFNAVSALALATLRLDGFVSLDSQARGELLTRPVTLDGDTLRINVDAARGRVRVAIVDADTLKPLEDHALEDCDAVTSDALRAAVTWRGQATLSPAARRGPVRLRFVVESASLYATWTDNA